MIVEGISLEFSQYYTCMDLSEARLPQKQALRQSFDCK